MVRSATLVFAASGLAAALMLSAAAQPSALAQTQPGLWEISGAPGTSAPIRQCVADVASLARFEHRSKACTAKILKDANSAILVEYTCRGAGFGNSEIDVITPRSLRISTQGISGGLPFNYVLQAHRIDDCPKTTASTRH